MRRVMQSGKLNASPIATTNCPLKCWNESEHYFSLLLKLPTEDMLARGFAVYLMSAFCFTAYKISWWFCFGVVELFCCCYLVLPLEMVCKDSIW